MSPQTAPDILLEIAARRRLRYGLERGEFRLPLQTPQTRLQDSASNRFCQALQAKRGRAVIAEVKLGSPKLGSLVGSFDPLEHAHAYREAGAAALSVVVEPEYFHGSYELLFRCQASSGLPAIAKDFVVSIEQLREAKAAGASAVLLIASLYDGATLFRFAEAARSLGLAPLVETHDERDLDKLALGEWELVGVNNRDLSTFRVDMTRSEALVRLLPAGCLRVAESGIRLREDVERLQMAGFDAFLIGEVLVKAPDPSAALAELLGTEP